MIEEVEEASRMRVRARAYAGTSGQVVRVREMRIVRLYQLGYSLPCLHDR